MFQRSGGIVVATVLLYNRLAALASLAPRQTGPVNILHPQANLSKCIDVSDGFLANGSEVRVFDCNDTPAQNWIIQQGPTTVQLNGTNLCLDAGNNPGNNVQILVLDCIAGRQAQQWNYTIDHDIILNGTDLCLDLMDGDPTNPNQLQISSCSNADTNQIWVEGPPGNGSTTPPPPPTGAPPPPQDLLVRTLHPNASSTKCVDVRDGNFANNTAVQVFDCDDTPAQNWIIERNSTKIQLNGTDFCLDAGSSPADGVQLKIFTCIADLPAQQWNYTIDNEIILNGTDLCLDLTGGVLTNSNQLQISNCSNADTNQIWVEDAPGNGTTTPSPPPTQSPPPVTNVTSVGTLHPIANAKKCIDVRGNGRANGTPVQVFDCNGTPAQNWVIQQGLTKVQLNGTNVCLDAGSKPANGVKMKIWECFEGLPAQQWRFTNDHLVLDGTGFCLDLTDGVLANSNQLQIWTCGRGNNNQVWSEGLPGNGTSTQPPPSPATVDTLHPIASSGKCIDVRGNGRANGTPVQVFDCNDTPAQNWKVQRGSTKVQLNGTNVCLDAGSKPAKGIKMKIWECFDGLAAQQWHYTDDNQLILEGTDFCLDLTDGGLANSNQLQTWTCGTGNKNQIWLEGPPGILPFATSHHISFHSSPLRGFYFRSSFNLYLTMPQYMTGRPRSTRSQFHLGNQKPLRAATPEELEQWSDAGNDFAFFNDDLIDLDEGRPYIFEKGDAAWVRTTKGTWCLGTVTTSPPRVGPTRDGDGLFYSVIFTLGGARMKKSFAPLNGDMKPDQNQIRALLSAYGWLHC